MTKLDFGVCYVARGSEPSFAYSAFLQNTAPDVPGLILTWQNPEEVRAAHPLEGTRVIWLAHGRPGDTRNPSDLEGLSKLIRSFVHENRKASIVLLDELDYLVANSSALQTAAFLGQLHAFVANEKAILLVVADPEAIEEGEWTFLTRGLRILEPDPVPPVVGTR